MGPTGLLLALVHGLLEREGVRDVLIERGPDPFDDRRLTAFLLADHRSQAAGFASFRVDGRHLHGPRAEAYVEELLVMVGRCPPREYAVRADWLARLFAMRQLPPGPAAALQLGAGTHASAAPAPRARHLATFPLARRDLEPLAGSFGVQRHRSAPRMVELSGPALAAATAFEELRQRFAEVFGAPSPPKPIRLKVLVNGRVVRDWAFADRELEQGFSLTPVPVRAGDAFQVVVNEQLVQEGRVPWGAPPNAVLKVDMQGVGGRSFDAPRPSERPIPVIRTQADADRLFGRGFMEVRSTEPPSFFVIPDDFASRAHMLAEPGAVAHPSPRRFRPGRLPDEVADVLALVAELADVDRHLEEYDRGTPPRPRPEPPSDLAFLARYLSIAGDHARRTFELMLRAGLTLQEAARIWRQNYEFVAAEEWP